MSDEKILLGMCLVDVEHYHDALNEGLKAEHFNQPRYRKLFEYLHELIGKGMDFDVANLIGSGLEANELAELFESSHSAQNVSPYARRIRNAAWGRKANKAMSEISHQILGELNLDDISHYQAKIQEMAQSLLRDGQPGEILEPAEIVTRLHQVLEERVKTFNQQETIGIPSGIEKLDLHVYGWKPGRLHILGARPGCGKTTIAVNFAWHAASVAKKNVLFFTNEMDAIEISEKVMSLVAAVDTSKLERGDLSDDEMDRISEASERFYFSKLRIADDTRMYAQRLFQTIRRMHRQGKCDFAIVDYLQQYRFEGKHDFRMRHLEIAEITMELKMLAKELGIPILCLAQLSREADKGAAPTLASLKDSGSIEQDADVVMLLYKEQKVENDRVISETTWLRIEKCRKGLTGRFPLSVDFSVNKFSEVRL